MQDAFFATSKSKKRKRGTGDAPKNKIPRKEKGSKLKKRAADEELDSDRTDEDDNIDDLDLRADDIPESSGDEDIIETPAQKRLRLAKLHLESVKEDLGTCHLDALPSYLSYIQLREIMTPPRSIENSSLLDFVKMSWTSLERFTCSLQIQ